MGVQLLLHLAQGNAMKRWLVLVLLVCPVAFCPAQSINVAIGPTDVFPDDSYAGVGQPGFWNAIEAQHTSNVGGIRDIDGNETAVRIRQIGGMQLLSFDDKATSGDDQALMDHCQLTFSAGLETCIFVDFLEPGEYEVICYAWMPGQPEVRAYVNSEEEPGNPHKIVEGGAWPGQHEELITYSRHQCFVEEGTNGLLRLHSGVVPGDSPALGAAMNGFQIRQVPDLVVGDLNGDGEVTLADIPLFVDALANDFYDPAADVNGDGDDNLADIPAFVQLLTG